MAFIRKRGNYSLPHDAALRVGMPATLPAAEVDFEIWLIIIKTKLYYWLFITKIKQKIFIWNRGNYERCRTPGWYARHVAGSAAAAKQPELKSNPFINHQQPPD